MYHLLYKATIFIFESIKNRNLYDALYNENWTWDAETKIKAQGLFTATKLFEHIVAFSLVFTGPEHLKPLVTKLQ